MAPRRALGGSFATTHVYQRGRKSVTSVVRGSPKTPAVSPFYRPIAFRAPPCYHFRDRACKTLVVYNCDYPRCAQDLPTGVFFGRPSRTGTRARAISPRRFYAVIYLDSESLRRGTCAFRPNATWVDQREAINERNSRARRTAETYVQNENRRQLRTNNVGPRNRLARRTTVTNAEPKKPPRSDFSGG